VKYGVDDTYGGPSHPGNVAELQTYVHPQWQQKQKGLCSYGFVASNLSPGLYRGPLIFFLLAWYTCRRKLVAKKAGS
jgi:hypothetical protein